MEQYTIVINGKPQGPYTLTELKHLDLTPNTFVRKPGMDDYKEAHAMAELRELFGFKHQKTAPQYFASFDLRLLASVIDHFVISIGYCLLILISFIFIEGKDQRLMAFLVPLPSILLIKLIYGSISEATVRQATVGKRLVGIKVTDLEGSRISASRSFIRNFSKVLSVIPAFFGYLYSFLNKKNQCWHDIAASTLVIKERLI